VDAARNEYAVVEELREVIERLFESASSSGARARSADGWRRTVSS
jgi:predicted RNA-binding Zn ribbon-like protein